MDERNERLQSEPHPQTIVRETRAGCVATMDSARYVDERNRGRDVVVAASYTGVLPARLMAPFAPRAVIGHDAGGSLLGAGISGLPYLEALGIPAATAAAETAELGNGAQLYEVGVISFTNLLAELAGVEVGMSVRDAADVLLAHHPGEVPASMVRRKVVETGPEGRLVVVTDSIIHAREEDRGRNVLVTAGHTGRSGADFIIEFGPWAFICSDGGSARNGSGTAGLAITERAGIAGASVDARTAAIGDAFSTYEVGIISACNGPARDRGVRIGQTAREASSLLLGGGPR